MERWASFDCYGTLVDWMGGIRWTLSRLWPSEDAARLLADYQEIEPRVQAGSAVPYREVMAQVLRAIANTEGLQLSPEEEGVLGQSLPDWPVFPEVSDALTELRRRGWRLAILSNTDPDLLATSLQRIRVAPDLTITEADAGSYKPAHGHWERFLERSGANSREHVHVAASLFHDIAPAAELGIRPVWINPLGETSDLPRAAELPDLTALPDTLDAVVPAS